MPTLAKSGDYGDHWHGGPHPCPACAHIPPPPQHTRGATCPICRNDWTEKLDRQHGLASWFCGRCCTVFEGSQSEWAANRERREKHDKWLSSRAEAS